MKFIIPIFILLLSFACDSPSKSHASTDNSDKKAEKAEIQKEIKTESIKIGTDEVIFKGFGTEPFWNAEVRKSGILFSKFGLDTMIFNYTEPKAAEGRLIESHHTYFLEDQDGKKAQLIAKKAEDCGCSDGMSDKEYGYHVFFLYDNQMFEGCGEKSVTSKE